MCLILKNEFEGLTSEPGLIQTEPHTGFMFERMSLCKTAPRSAMGSPLWVALISLLAYTGRQAGCRGHGFWLQFASVNPPTVTITTQRERAQWRALSRSAATDRVWSIRRPSSPHQHWPWQPFVFFLRPESTAQERWMEGCRKRENRRERERKKETRSWPCLCWKPSASKTAH